MTLSGGERCFSYDSKWRCRVAGASNCSENLIKTLVKLVWRTDDLLMDF